VLARRTRFIDSHSIEESGNQLSKILDIVASHSSESIGDACIVTLLVSDDRLKIAAVHHADPKVLILLQHNMLNYEFKMEQSIISKVILSGEPILLPSVVPGQVELFNHRDFERLFEIVGIDSVLIVPIKGQHNVLGTIRLTRDKGGQPYTGEDQSFLMDIARRTALAIENCYLLTRSGRKSRTPEAETSGGGRTFRSIYESRLGILLWI
jgi:GAF domain-containing protein